MATICIYLLKVNIVLILLYLCYYFVLRRLTFYTTNRFYLLGSIIASWLIPLLPSVLHSNHTYATYPLLQPIIWQQVQVSMVQHSTSYSYWSVVYIIYGLGVIAFTTMAILQGIQLYRIHTKAVRHSSYHMCIWLVQA